MPETLHVSQFFDEFGHEGAMSSDNVSMNKNSFISDVDVVTTGNTSSSSASQGRTSVTSISFPCETDHVAPPTDHIKSIQLSITIDKQINSLKSWSNMLLMDCYVGGKFHK